MRRRAVTMCGVVMASMLATPIRAAPLQEATDLFELSLDELLRVEVTVATRTRRALRSAPGIITVIGRDEILASGARTLADLLKRVPGVQVLNDFAGQRQVWIRGVVTAENERVLLLIDGVPRREAASANWSPDEHLDINELERVEIIRGPGSALYGGNAYAGVIALHTRRGASPLRVQVSAGSHDSTAVHISGGSRGELGSVHMAGGVQQTNGWESERGRNGAPSDNSTERSAETLQLRLDLDSGFQVDLTAGYLDYRYPLHPVNDRRDSYYDYQLLALHYAWQWQTWNARTRLSVDNSRFGFDTLSRNPDQTLRQVKKQQKRSLVYGWEGQLDWQADADVHWLFGANAEQNRAGRIEEEWNPTHSNPARHYFINSWLAQHGEPPGDNTAETFNYGFYSQRESFHFDERLGVTAGLRWDRFEGFGDQFSPRLGLVHLPSPNTAIKLLAGRAFRPPTIRQLFVQRSDGKQPGNPDLDPELVTTYELEWLQQLDERVHWRVDVFANRFTDTTVTVAEGPWQSSPIPRYIQGVELELKGGFAFADWQASWNINHTNLFRAYDDTPHGNVDIPYLATRLANAGLTLHRGDWRLYSALNWVGRRNEGLSYDPVSGDILDTYHSDPGFSAYPTYRARDNKGAYLTQDLSVQWQRGGFSTELIVYNLWDKRHFDPTYDPDIYYDVTREPRSVLLRFAARF